MTELLNILLNLVVTYGYPTLVLIIVCGDLGIPLPVTSVLLAAGSLAIDNTLNLFILIPLVALTAICGDIAGYLLAQKYGHHLEKYFSRIGVTAKMLTSVDVFLKDWGGWCVFLTRWLITPLGVPVNIIAGLSNFSFTRFLISVCVGEFLWATIYIYLGYLFGINWIALQTYIGTTPAILALIIVGILSLLIALRVIFKHNKTAPRK